MTIDTETLRKRLQQLRLAGISLAELLQVNANRLDTIGAPPPSAVSEELRKYHEQYANLTSLFYPEADAQNVQQARSLAELEEELQQREATRHVISVARSILQIQTRDGKPLPSLHELHTLASETIANFGAHLTPEQIQVFVEGRHPWHDLIHMVQDGGSLPDAEWTELNTSIESSLGLALAIAAARGRLEITNSIEPEAAPDSPDHLPQHSFTDPLPASNRQTGIEAPTQPAAIVTPNSEKESEPATLHFPVKPSLSTTPDTVSSSAMADDSRAAQSDAEVALARTSPRSSAFARALTKSTNERPLKPQLSVVTPEVPTEDKLPATAVNEAKVPTALNDLQVHRSESVTLRHPSPAEDSSQSVFDDIEPVALKRKYDPSVATSISPPVPDVSKSVRQNPDPLDVSSLSIFDEDAPPSVEPAKTRLVDSSTIVASSTSSASPLAERLLELARFADATGASASLAGMILNGLDSDRVELMPDLILHLIQEGRAGVAYHLSRSLEARAVRQRPFVPSWLIRTWTFGHSLVFPKGQLAGLLQDELHSRPATDLRESSSDWRLAISLFVRASTLRPAIIAPTSRAASLLRDFDLQSGCVQLYNYCSRIGAYGERIQGVFPGMFKLSSASEPHTDQLKTLHTDLTTWKESSNTVSLKLQVTSPLFQKTGWSLRAGTSQRYPEAAFDWMNWQLALRIGESLTTPVMEDRRSDLIRVKAEIEEITTKLSTSDSSEGRRQFSQPEVRAYLRQAITFAQRWISLHSGTSGNDSQNYLPQAATELRAEIQTRHEPVLAELRALAADHPSFEVRMAVACLMQSVQEIHNLVDPNHSTDNREPDPRHLLHAELLKISDLRLGTNWEPETDLPSLEEEILQFLSQPQPDWIMAFKMQLAQGNHHLAERILSLTHWSNAERDALQSVLESDRQRQRTDFTRELNDVKALLAESLQLDILKDSERAGLESRLDRLRRIASSDNDVSSGVRELGRVRDLLVKRREREADRVRSRLRQLNNPAANEGEGTTPSGTTRETTQSRGWVMDFDS